MCKVAIKYKIISEALQSFITYLISSPRAVVFEDSKICIIHEGNRNIVPSLNTVLCNSDSCTCCTPEMYETYPTSSI